MPAHAFRALAYYHVLHPLWWITHVHHPAAARPNCMDKAAGRLCFVAAQPGPQSHCRRCAKRCRREQPRQGAASQLMVRSGARGRNSFGVLPTQTPPQCRLGWGGPLGLAIWAQINGRGASATPAILLLRRLRPHPFGLKPDRSLVVQALQGPKRCPW